MTDFAFSSAFNIGLLLVAAVTAVILAGLAYRRTNPPVSPLRRFFLAALRASGIFLLFLLLGEPILSFLHREVQPPVLVVLVDNSRSMTISDRTGKRSDLILKTLGHPAIHELAETAVLRYVAIGGRPRILDSFHPDSLKFDANETDITSAVRTAGRMSLAEPVAAVLIVSDGNDTGPGSPVFDPEAFRLPIFAVGIGDTMEQRDVVIRRVTANAVVYSGTETPVNVHLKSSGSSGERVILSLRQGANVLDRKEISLGNGTLEYQTVLSYKPAEPGHQRYTVEVSPIPGELTTSNNRAVFSATVIDRKARISIIAGAPSPDVAFVRRSLEADSAFQVRVFAEGMRNTEPIHFEETDCMILIGFPTARSDRSLLPKIRDAAERGAGLFFIPSRILDYDALSTIVPALPFTVEQPAGTEITVFIRPRAQPLDPFLHLPASYGEDPWSLLPPVFALDARMVPKPESRIHAVSRGRTAVRDEPVLLSRNVNKMRSAAFLAYGLWRWNMLGDASTNGILDPLVVNIVQWLTIREENRRIRVAPLRDMFTEGDPVEFEAQVYDEAFRPVEDARITMTARSGNQRFDLTLSPLGDGRYEGAISGAPKGEYVFSAEVKVGGNVLARPTGSFSVGESNTEFVETRANLRLLRQLAVRSGGRFYHPDSLSTLADDIRSLPAYEPREIVKSSDFRFWNHLLSLTASLVFFVLEWILRKQSGML